MSRVPKQFSNNDGDNWKNDPDFLVNDRDEKDCKIAQIRLYILFVVAFNHAPFELPAS